MTEETMMDRVGWAIAREGSRIDVGETPYHLRVARAAIEAMRVPTEAMLDAGEDSLVDERQSIGYGWESMIDAALKP
jgi:hypothetical protein